MELDINCVPLELITEEMCAYLFVRPHVERACALRLRVCACVDTAWARESSIYFGIGEKQRRAYNYIHLELHLLSSHHEPHDRLHNAWSAFSSTGLKMPSPILLSSGQRLSINFLIKEHKQLQMGFGHFFF